MGNVVLRFGIEDVFLLFDDARRHLHLGVLEVLARESDGAGIVHLVFVDFYEVAAIAVGHHLFAVVSDEATAVFPAVVLDDEFQFVVKLDGALVEPDGVGRRVEIAVTGGLVHVATYVGGHGQHPLLALEVDAHALSLLYLAVFVACGREDSEGAQHDVVDVLAVFWPCGLYVLADEIDHRRVAEELLVGEVEKGSHLADGLVLDVVCQMVLVICLGHWQRIGMPGLRLCGEFLVDVGDCFPELLVFVGLFVVGGECLVGFCQVVECLDDLLSFEFLLARVGEHGIFDEAVVDAL